MCSCVCVDGWRGGVREERVCVCLGLVWGAVWGWLLLPLAGRRFNERELVSSRSQMQSSSTICILRHQPRYLVQVPPEVRGTTRTLYFQNTTAANFTAPTRSLPSQPDRSHSNIHSSTTTPHTTPSIRTIACLAWYSFNTLLVHLYNTIA
jgi:hypothetical protein